MNIDNFRQDFLARVSDTGISQMCLAREYGVQQAALSRFMRGKSNLSVESLIALWPFVYGTDFPKISMCPLSQPAAAQSTTNQGESLP